jgi:hypothetical protein
MDFDDMPDSYFAFLSNQRKVGEPDRVNGAMRDVGRGSESSQSAGRKVKPRQSTPNMGQLGSKPSVPSLPSIQRTSTQPITSGKHHSSGPRLPTGKSSGQLSAPRLPPTNPGLAANLSMRMGGPAVAAPGKSNALVFTLVGILVAAIVVLAYLVLTK